MTSLEIARAFEQVADLLELQGADRFRVEAYRRAANSIETASENLVYLRDRDALLNLPGVGAAISKKIEELLETGRLRYLEELQAQIPPGLPALLEIPGLGPKKVRALWQGLGLTTIDELEAAAKAQRVRDLAGMGAKTEENILKGIERYRAHRERMRLGDALPYAENLVASLQRAAGGAIGRIEIAGSARRRVETVGDLDLVATASNPEQVMDAFVHLPETREVRLHGPTRSTIFTSAEIQVDLRIVPPESFGALLQHSTGSKAHNIRLREMAQRRGGSISEYGIADARTGQHLVAGEDACDLYAFVGLPCIPPELREDRGEIEAAERNALPDLVAMEDIRGDLHAHTRHSDGANTVAEMGDAAQEMGYEYLALTDHSVSLDVAHGLSVDALLKRAEEIDDYNAAQRGFHLLNGTECDIRTDGTLDYPGDVLEQLDIVVASVHSRFGLSREEMTDRVVKAIDSGHVDVLGHPTGRIINRRESYDLDLERVFEAAQRTDTAIEINSFPDRLDLRDVDARSAKEHGVRLALGSDAHHRQHLPLLRYGVYTARRAWLEPADLLNTRPLGELLKLLRRRA